MMRVSPRMADSMFCQVELMAEKSLVSAGICFRMSSARKMFCGSGGRRVSERPSPLMPD